MTDNAPTPASQSDDALVEELRVLYVWPQSVADHHANALTPRQIDMLYNVGKVADKAADRIEQLEKALRQIVLVDADADPVEAMCGIAMKALGWEGIGDADQEV